jgi:TIR domain-containing protein/macro domain-containing protein
MSLVFVNYRVRDDSGYATLIHRELERHLGSGNVFLASQSIRAGDDYVREVFTQLRACSVVLAVIGSQWAAARDASVFDWVREEIAEAFAAGIRVIPVLTDDAELPAEPALPEAIAALAHTQVMRVRHYSFDSDFSALVGELRRVLPAHQRGPATGACLASGHRIYRDPPGHLGTACRLGIVPGSIRRVGDVDVWVNSENTCMQMARHNEFSISAIIRYGGAIKDQSGHVVEDVVADRLAAVTAGRPVAPGTAIATPPGRLAETHNVRRVIHVAAVHGEPGAGFRQVRNVDQCVRNVLAVAEREAATDPTIRTILFPLLGTGTATGAELGSTADAMVQAVLDHLVDRPGTALREIDFLAYTADELTHLRQAMETTVGVELGQPAA